MLSNEFFLPEYTEIEVGCGKAPDPTAGAYSALQAPMAGFEGPLGGRRGMEGGEEFGKREGRGKGKRGRDGKSGSWGMALWLLGRETPMFTQATVEAFTIVQALIRSDVRR